jgi:hypothetical protein
METVLGTTKEVSREVSAEKSKYMFRFCYQNEEQNKNIKVGNKSLKKCIEVQIFGKDSNK